MAAGTVVPSVPGRSDLEVPPGTVPWLPTEYHVPFRVVLQLSLGGRSLESPKRRLESASISIRQNLFTSEPVYVKTWWSKDRVPESLQQSRRDSQEEQLLP